ncbi:hypothetical protein LTR66_014179, partial [Elasticomyces elasticus]
MPYVKPTLTASRIAATATKAFTHGYTQTLVAASQSSYASSNTNLGPLNASNLTGRFRTGQSQFQKFYNAVPSVRTGADVAPERPETANPESGLAQYYAAWHKDHRPDDVREWQQFQFAKRIEWKPPLEATRLRHYDHHAVVEDVSEEKDTALPRAGLKRAYTTSVIDDFRKEVLVTEARVTEESPNGEILRSKDEDDIVQAAFHGPARSDELLDQLPVSPADVSAPKQELAIRAGMEALPQEIRLEPTAASSAVSFKSTDGTATSEVDSYSAHFESLIAGRQYGDIPVLFEAMLRSGVKRPSQAAYRALLIAAVQLPRSKHQSVPKALEVYSDMLRRRVYPDTATYAVLINLLSSRALEVSVMKDDLDANHMRYRGLDAEGQLTFRSNQAEYDLLAEDNSLAIALKLLDASASRSATKTTELPHQTYTLLAAACAQSGKLPDMMRLYERMESKQMVPSADTFASMIAAFAKAGDLRSSVAWYDKYRALAVKNDEGVKSVVRNDNDVYASLIKAYGDCERIEGGRKFLDRIEAQIPDPVQLRELRDTVAVKAFIPLLLQGAASENVFEVTKDLTPQAWGASMCKICVTAADKNDFNVSMRAFDLLTRTQLNLAGPPIAMLALYIRNANVEGAEPYWRVLESFPATAHYVEPTTMRAIALIGIGQADRGLVQTRQMFSRVRDLCSDLQSRTEAVEQIDEAIGVIGRSMIGSRTPHSPASSAQLLHLMAENGGLVSPIAEHVVAEFGAEQISQLQPTDVNLLIRIQSQMILNEASLDIAGPARFAYLLENVVSRSILPDVPTENLIEKTLVNLNRSDLHHLWSGYRYPSEPVFPPTKLSTMSQLPPVAPAAVPPLQPAFDDSFDPYASRTDNKGSIAITDLLEKTQGRSSTNLNEALTKFRNMRRAGRHPRFYTYAKLIMGAAKENQLNLAHDILEMAKQDVPFQDQYRIVRYGWVTILDSMVAACLTVGRRDLAAKFHRDLLDMGAAPSANTYGLYITTLKESTKTFDEATEAVHIFQRAKSESVEPSSFLYNALIGKLGKARRIDDCLFYFSQMREAGIRPTSVTYGTIVNALCRVSDEKFAEQIFEEMEGMPNYKPRPAPYHSLMQFFLSTKRDRSKVLAYYERMRAKNIQPT